MCSRHIGKSFISPEALKFIETSSGWWAVMEIGEVYSTLDLGLSMCRGFLILAHDKERSWHGGCLLYLDVSTQTVLVFIAVNEEDKNPHSPGLLSRRISLSYRYLWRMGGVWRL